MCVRLTEVVTGVVDETLGMGFFLVRASVWYRLSGELDARQNSDCRFRWIYLLSRIKPKFDCKPYLGEKRCYITGILHAANTESKFNKHKHKAKVVIKFQKKYYYPQQNSSERQSRQEQHSCYR